MHLRELSPGLKENYEAKIDAEVAKVKEETQTTALAEMLGDMRKEMHQFAVPFFKEQRRDVYRLAPFVLVDERKRLGCLLDEVLASPCCHSCVLHPPAIERTEPFPHELIIAKRFGVVF